MKDFINFIPWNISPKAIEFSSMKPCFLNPKSLKEVAERTSTPQDFHYHLANAIDHFNQLDSPKQKEMFLHPPPTLLRTICYDDGYCDAFIAAACQRLCERNQIDYPPWIFDKERYLSSPVFFRNSPEGRLYVLLYAEPAFKSRNLFFLDSILYRT